MPVERRGNVVVSLGHWARGEALAPLVIPLTVAGKLGASQKKINKA